MSFRNRERDAKAIKPSKTKTHAKLGVCFRGGESEEEAERQMVFMMNLEDGFGFLNNALNTLFL